MNNFKEKCLKKDIYKEELIRIDYSCSNNFKSKLESIKNLMTQMRLYKIYC